MNSDYPQLNHMVDDLVNKRAPSAYPAGIEDWDKAYLQYAPESSTQPTLTVVNPIYDNNDDVIMPGYYNIILSYDRKFLIMIQSEKIVAVIPIFKIEEDKSQIENQQPHDKKELKKIKKEQKNKDKINKKRIKNGEDPLFDEIYTDASIEYDKDGNYYLIKYERGAIRAWGAIK